uniref:Uncharacterized protein n=2 Tax=Panagrolaimus sp. JU765 TaxID=591449 RepID=A0AC34R3C1_9BILA
MQNIVPIYIVLEVKKGAPSIDFEFSKISNEERVNLRDSWKKMKTTNVGKNQKIRTISGASSAMSDTPTTQPPTLPEENKGKKERIMPTQENCFGRRKYAEVVVETLRPKNVAEKPAGSVEPSGSSSSIAGPGLPDRAGSVEPVKPDKIVYFCGNP